MAMHKPTKPPACFRSEEPAEIDYIWRDKGRWCYQTVAQARTHDEGCFGCSRFLEERRAVNDLSTSKAYLQRVADDAAEQLGVKCDE